MTAILGFNYLDGVLLMADTEESLGGGAKSRCEKLFRFVFPIGPRAATIITGGSGDSHLIECANQEMHRFFAESSLTSLKPGELLDALNVFASTFFAETTGRYQGLALELVPGLEMLIAVSFNGTAHLFCWKHNRVVYVRAPQHAAIGSGVVQLHPMLSDVQFSGTKECMFFHGIRMMAYAKRSVVGVGGKTESIALQNDGATHYFGVDAAQKTEDLVLNFEELLHKVLIPNISTIETNIKDVDKNVEESLNGMPSTFIQYRDEYRKILQMQLDAIARAFSTEV